MDTSRNVSRPGCAIFWILVQSYSVQCEATACLRCSTGHLKELTKLVVQSNQLTSLPRALGWVFSLHFDMFLSYCLLQYKVPQGCAPTQICVWGALGVHSDFNVYFHQVCEAGLWMHGVVTWFLFSSLNSHLTNLQFLGAGENFLVSIPKEIGKQLWEGWQRVIC